MGEKDNYYRALFDQTNDAVFILSLDGKQTRVNKSASDMLGYTQNEIQLLSYKDLSAEENDSKKVLELLLSGEKVPTYERKFRKKDGTIITVEINAQLIMDEKGNPLQIQSVIRDISVRNEIDEKFENIFKVKLGLLSISDLEGNFLKVNNEWERTLGFSTLELEQMKLLDLVHPDDIENTIRTKSRLKEHNDVLGFINRYRCKDGSYKYIEWSSQLQGSWIYSTARDITDKINEEVSLKKMLLLSEEFIQLYEKEFDYQKITDDFLNISGAKFACFNLYDEDGKHFTTMGTAGDINVLEKIIQILGINLAGKKWNHDLTRSAKIKDKVITRFSSVYELADTIIPRSTLNLLVEAFDIGETVLIKILKNDIMLGDFTFFMPNGKSFSNDSIAEVYTRQLGMAITQKRTESILKKERERLVNIIKGTNVGTWEWNIQTGEIFYNERWAEIIGYKLDEISPVSTDTLIKFIHPDDLKKSDDMIDKVLSKEINYYEIEYRMKHKDGSWVWIQDRGNVISWTNDGKPYLMSGTHSDITQRKKMEKLIFDEKERLKTTLLSIGEGVISTDVKGKVLLLNKVAEQLTGWKQEEAFGRPMDEVFNIIDGSTREKRINPVYDVLKKGENFETSNTILISQDNVEHQIEQSAAPIKGEDSSINGVELVFRDITEKNNRQLEIEYLSYRDQLTGLYNRRFFAEELIRLDNERNLPLTIVIIDVNGLKLTNDAFGHIMGDKLLQKVAEVLKRESRKDEIIARIGGDEFVILLPKTNSDEASVILNRINNAIVNEKINSMNLSISFGWATKQDISEEMSVVFKKAEDYMYSRKMFERTSTRYKTIDLIIKTLFEKNESEERHSMNVSEFSALMASSLELSSVETSELRTLGLMHDIGKIAIDENIINKPGPLNASDWVEVKRHPEIGYRILSSVNEYAAISEYVLAHHERWDGLGYPKKLKGVEIPWQARIITIADAYDAMTSERPYRKALSKFAAIEEIRKNIGTQFDPDFAQVFIDKVFPLLDN